MPDEIIKVPCLKIKQKGLSKESKEVEFYVTALPIKYLINASIDRYTRDNPDGYQRAPDQRRLSPRAKGSITYYILNGWGILPTGVLLNVREELEFEEIKKVTENISWGYLIINLSETKFWIVDGQHRLEALKRLISMGEEEISEYPLPIIISNFADKFFEMLMFNIVQSTQKRLSTDIVWRHLQRMYLKIIEDPSLRWIEDIYMTTTKKREALATIIVDILDRDTRSPFFRRIRMPGDPPDEKYLVEDRYLIRYIAKVLRERVFSSRSPEDLAGLFIKYWNAIRKLYPNCFKPEEKDNYTLLKHTGIAVFTYLFPKIYALCAEEGNISEGNMEKYLRYLLEDLRGDEDAEKKLGPDFVRPINETWWSRIEGPAIASATSEKMFNLIADKFAEKIDLVRKKKIKSRV